MRALQRKPPLCPSTTTTRTTGFSSLIGTDLGFVHGCGKGQENRHGGALTGARACGLELAAVGAHEGLRDPKAKTRSRGRRRVAGAAKKTFSDLRVLGRREPDAAGAHREHDVMAVAFGGGRGRPAGGG